MSVLFCQISTNLINPLRNDISSQYYEKIWTARQDEGYVKPKDFWEIPNWVALLRRNIGIADFKIIRKIDKFVEFLNGCDSYHYICFSVLEANKALVKEIIDKYVGNATFALGGYINLRKYFAGYDNVAAFETIKDFSCLVSGNFVYDYDYSDFRGYKCIPRLALSTGCRHRCMFCTVSNKLKEIDQWKIEDHIKAFRNLNFKLVYLNDKTFGQAKNRRLLPKLSEKIKAINNNFEGFIIQTTPAQLLKMDFSFLEKSQVKFIELGVETFNDPILKKHRKPSSERHIAEATKRFRDSEIRLIPNLIVGFPQETMETYGRTLHYVEENRDVISHLNVYNLAIYEGADLAQQLKVNQTEDTNELSHIKSFHKDKRPHQWFHDAIFNLGLELLA